jgi:DNA-binding NarL/FixJ family response regulator
MRGKDMEKLTDREQYILQFVMQGCENREIAQQIHVSIHTVKAHISAIIRKTAARNRTHLVYLAMKNGWIE